MNYTAEHRGFTLIINEVLDAQQNPIYFEAECTEIKFSVKGFHKEYRHSMQSFFKLVSKFKDYVDEFTEEKKRRKTEVFVNCCVPIIEEIANDYPDKINIFHQLVIDFRDSLTKKEELAEDKHSIPDSTYEFFCTK